MWTWQHIGGQARTAARVGVQILPASSLHKNDGFSLNAVDIALDKPMDESPWASGYHVELMFGPDSGPVANNWMG